MGRWTQYDEDAYRLPEGVTRTAYDADTRQYTFSTDDGTTYLGAPGSRYNKPKGVQPGPSRRPYSARKPAPTPSLSEKKHKPLPDLPQKEAPPSAPRGGVDHLLPILPPNYTPPTQEKKAPVLNNLSLNIPNRVRSIRHAVLNTSFRKPSTSSAPNGAEKPHNARGAEATDMVPMLQSSAVSLVGGLRRKVTLLPNVAKTLRRTILHSHSRMLPENVSGDASEASRTSARYQLVLSEKPEVDEEEWTMII